MNDLFVQQQFMDVSLHQTSQRNLLRAFFTCRQVMHHLQMDLWAAGEIRPLLLLSAAEEPKGGHLNWIFNLMSKLMLKIHYVLRCGEKMEY